MSNIKQDGALVGSRGLARRGWLPVMLLVAFGALGSLGAPAIPAVWAGTCDNAWTCSTVFTGTTGQLVAVGAAIRAIGADDEVFIAYDKDELSNVSGQTADHFDQTVLNYYTCADAECTSPTLESATTLSGSTSASASVLPDMRLPSMAAWVHSARTNRVSIVQKDGDASCGFHQHHEGRWTTNGRQDEINVDAACGDRGFSDIVHTLSYIHACWTIHVNSGGIGDRVFCGSRPYSSTTWGSGVNLSDSPGSNGLVGSVQDHAVIVIKDGDRVVALHEKDGANHSIWLVFPDESPGVKVELVSVSHEVNFPFIGKAANGDLKVGYLEDSDSNGTNDRIVLLSCLASNSCQSGVHWVGEFNQPPASGFHLHRPEFISATSGREFMMWTEESTSGADTEVRLSTRCPGGAWSAEVHPWNASAGLNEDNQFGLPHIAFDHIDETVHVVMIEKSGVGSSAKGNVIWARNTYGLCP